jgi:hypothetical protein
MKKIVMLKHFDMVNRRNIILQKPVFGEDLRKSVQIDVLFSDTFHAKKHKYVDRQSKNLKQLNKIPSTVFNPFA